MMTSKPLGGSGTTIMKLKEDEPRSPDASNAYLGPKLWDKPISLQEFNEEDFFVMNIDEFLAENNLQLDAKDRSAPHIRQGGPVETSPEPETLACTSPHRISCSSPPARPSIIVANRDMKRPAVAKGSHDFLYSESKRAKLEREKEERRRRREEEIEFAPEDLALATVPGADFDPRERSFDMEELRPQPIIRKRPKVFVAPEQKDEKYWDTRAKNTVAARRSREARRLKENQIALRAAFLEKENGSLKREMESANIVLAKQRIEVDILRQKLAKYEVFEQR